MGRKRKASSINRTGYTKIYYEASLFNTQLFFYDSGYGDALELPLVKRESLTAQRIWDLMLLSDVECKAIAEYCKDKVYYKKL